MATPENDGSVCFLYGTVLGRGLLKIVQGLHLDRLAVWYLRSRLSKPYIARFAAKNGIALSREELSKFPTYRDFFLRERALVPVDGTPGHLISPCDGWLSAYSVAPDSTFAIKGSRYRVRDLLGDGALAENYEGGTCLVFRLCASDYHHYCYIDDGYQGPNHFMEGQLHSVQPIACEHYPIFTLNRRSWCLLQTEHFGPVIETEIGALVVGGIVNAPEGPMARGWEKGYFDLCGSTIVLLLEPGRVQLIPAYADILDTEREQRVIQGQWVATAIET
ncbi:MAG: phosphatidylserine decarboxylase [Clostridia bacterium]|nr:phosphatidylserine decarboxylase [Clostridia bacterium]